jgi:transcriptional regulator with XRE-family HTH domain
VLTSDQIRAARALLGWSARELAARARVNITTVQRRERGAGQVNGNASSMLKIQTALEDAGIEFLTFSDGHGVRIKRPERPASS